MRLLLACLAVLTALLTPRPACAAFTITTSVKSVTVDPNGTTTAAADTTGADLLVYVVAWYDVGTAPVITDSKSNTTPTNRTTFDDVFSTTMIRTSYVLPNHVGAGHTFTASCTGCYPAIIVLVVDNNPSASFDAGNESSAPSVSTTAMPGMLTPSVNGCLVVTGLGSAIVSSPSTTVDSPFTAVSRVALGPGTNVQLDVAYSIQTTATAANPTWSDTGSSLANMEVFKPTGPGPVADVPAHGLMTMGVGE